MVVSLELPRVIYEKVRERGLDIEDLVMYALMNAMQLDPGELARARLELADKYLSEAREYVGKGDAVQASEKAYKAVEECVKALAEKFNIPEYQEAVRSGRWFAYLLGRAARTLSGKLGESRIVDAWSRAYDLHMWGFHEGKYGIDYVKVDMPLIEWFVNYTRQLVAR
ncbi:PaREP1 family protein [Vulcanisaeta sp. JCM 16161]|uniref:PaREP1 family protein n=1 Tax=Vulcanisaeta sp. JCM 16161 TaxID=1295372 RepID=UPI0006D12568|nr:PaREP1 family protein [Vulcanisaeta sp. JCM 16161]